MGYYILLAVACGLATYIIAEKKNLKNPVLWAIGGAVFSVIALGAIVFIKKKVQEKKAGY